jgi:hypothetical protein
MPYLIRHKTTNAYLNKWFLQDKFGHWVENKNEAERMKKKEADKLIEYLGNKVEVLKVRKEIE